MTEFGYQSFYFYDGEPKELGHIKRIYSKSNPKRPKHKIMSKTKAFISESLGYAFYIEFYNKKYPVSAFGEFAHRSWFKDDKLHRDSGPAKEDHVKNIFIWYQNGFRHRDIDPAVITPDEKIWLQNDKMHRENGPAVIYTDEFTGITYLKYYKDGLLHREDGHAYEVLSSKISKQRLPDNDRFKDTYYLNGNKYDFNEWLMLSPYFKTDAERVEYKLQIQEDYA